MLGSDDDQENMVNDLIMMFSPYFKDFYVTVQADMQTTMPKG